jgi:hypothetical protein
MKEKILKKWVKALRSGKYKKGQGQLAILKDSEDDNSKRVKYCCLGVLCDLYAKETGIKWDGDLFEEESGALPKAVMKWAGLKSDDPHVLKEENGHGNSSAAELNDQTEPTVSFNKLADLLVKAQKERRLLH